MGRARKIVVPKTANYTDHVLKLNLDKQRSFQTYEFWLNDRHPVGVVPSQAYMPDIEIALLTGVLTDITGKEDEFLNVGKDLDVKTFEEVGLKTFYGRDAKGSLFVLIPRDQAHQDEIEAQIAKDGTLPIDRTEAMRNSSGSLSGIRESELDPQPSIILTDLE